MLFSKQEVNQQPKYLGEPLCVIIIVDDIEEAQPVFYHPQPTFLFSKSIVCAKCGNVWAKIHMMSSNGGHEYHPVSAYCEYCYPTMDCKGSFMQYPTRWAGYDKAPWEQKFGPKLLQRELRLAEENVNIILDLENNESTT